MHTLPDCSDYLNHCMKSTVSQNISEKVFVMQLLNFAYSAELGILVISRMSRRPTNYRVEPVPVSGMHCLFTFFRAGWLLGSTIYITLCKF